MQSIWFAGKIFSTHVQNTSFQPGLFLIARAGFSKNSQRWWSLRTNFNSLKTYSIYNRDFRISCFSLLLIKLIFNELWKILQKPVRQVLVESCARRMEDVEGIDEVMVTCVCAIKALPVVSLLPILTSKARFRATFRCYGSCGYKRCGPVCITKNITTLFIRKIHLLNSIFLLITNVISLVYHVTILVTIFILFRKLILGEILSLLWFHPKIKVARASHLQMAGCSADYSPWPST